MLDQGMSARHREALSGFEVKACGLDRSSGVAVEVAAVGEPALQRNQPVLPTPEASGAADVFEEGERAAGAQNAVDLGKRGVKVCDRAQADR